MDPDFDLPTCQQCGRPMQLLGKLPPKRLSPAIRVYQCNPCIRIEAIEAH